MLLGISPELIQLGGSRQIFVLRFLVVFISLVAGFPYFTHYKFVTLSRGSDNRRPSSAPEPQSEPEKMKVGNGRTIPAINSCGRLLNPLHGSG